MLAIVNQVLPDGYILLVCPKPYKPQRWVVKCHDKKFNVGDYVNYDPKKNSLEPEAAFKNCQHCLLPYNDDTLVCLTTFVNIM